MAMERAGMASAAVAPLSLDAVVGRIEEMSSLPHVAMKVLETAQDPESGAADLKRIVETDPSLSARVIRVVNSAAMGLRTNVGNLYQAISLLGFSNVRNLALTASVSQLFQSDDLIGAYKRSALWRHLISVGIGARLVASRRRLANFEDAFLAGLLHDIGIVLLDEHAHEQFCEVMKGLQDDQSLAEVEQSVMGFTHVSLGEQVAVKWNFPPVIRGAIRYHHASQLYKGADSEIVRCVEIANVICTMKGITSVGRKLVQPNIDVFREMGYQKTDIVVLAKDLDRELKLNESLFAV